MGTLIHLDGMDLYDDYQDFAARYVATNVNNASQFGTTSGRFSGGGFTPTGSTRGIGVNTDNTKNYKTFGFAYKSDLGGALNAVAGIFDSVTPVASVAHAAVHVNSDGSIGVSGGDTFTQSAVSSTGVITANNWFYIEVKFFKDQTSGLIAVAVNGVEVVTFAGDTQEATSGGDMYVHIGYFSGSGQTIALDDFYIKEDASANDAYLGDVRVETLYPDADTATEEWTLSAGSDTYALIDDTLGGDGDTTYISASTVGLQSEVGVTNSAVSPTTIHAVQVKSKASKTDAGSIEYKHYLYDSGTSPLTPEYSAAITPSESTYGPAYSLHESNPATASAWTPTDIDNLVLGVEITG